MQKGDKTVITAWAVYDWANSVFPLVITSTIFPIYYGTVARSAEGGTLQLFGAPFHPSVVYDYTIALAFLIIAIASPFLSGIADYTGKKKRFMQVFCYIGAAACSAMFFFDESNVLFGLFCLMLAAIGYSGSVVFYNAFLPEIAEPKDHDRVSAKGYALGYIGSSILLLFNLSMILFPELYSMEDPRTGPKVSFLLTGLWWALFAQYTFWHLPDNVHNRKPEGNRITKGYEELRKVWRELKNLPQLTRYLLAFFIFNMAVQTVIYAATLFAKDELELDDAPLITSILIIQFVAIVGSYFFSWLSEKKGNVFSLSASIFVWVGLCAAAYFLEKRAPNQFYLLAFFVGLVMGGVQSLSRSTYSKMLPDTVDHASYFSFFDVCNKVGIVLGMGSYGLIHDLTGSARNSITVLLLFFVVGLFLLWRTPRNRLMPAGK